MTTAGEIVLIMIIAFVVVILMPVVFFNTEQRHALFRENGIETTLYVTDCYTTVSRGRTTRTYTHVRYEYTAEGVPVTGEDVLDGSCEQYPLNSTMPGVYLKNASGSVELMSMEQLNAPFFVRQPISLIALAGWAGCLACLLAGIYAVFKALYELFKHHPDDDAVTGENDASSRNVKL